MVFEETEDTLLKLTDKISKALDEGKYTIGVFLDLSKAFDTVNHEILFTKTTPLWDQRYMSTLVYELSVKRKNSNSKS